MATKTTKDMAQTKTTKDYMAHWRHMATGSVLLHTAVAKVGSQGLGCTQLWLLRQIGKSEEHRVRLLVVSDPYAAQCRASIQRWDGARWHDVASLLTGEIQTEKGLEYRTGVTEAEFQGDLDALLLRACQTFF